MQTRTQNQRMKMLVELGPLALFFIINSLYGIYYGTAALVVATIFALGYSWITVRRIPAILAFGCGAVVLFGALTLIFENDLFIKIKPTVASLIIGGLLLGGMLAGRNPLKAVLGETLAFEMPPHIWTRLTWIWIAMFLTIAVANEWAWRNLTTDGWVTFKVFGLTAISLGFGLAGAAIMMRHGKQK